MQVLWTLERAFIKEIVDALPSPQPHYNSVSTMVKLLEKKGFVKREKLGNAHRYTPVVAKDDYKEGLVNDVVEKFFDNSPAKLVNYFAKEQRLSSAELERVLRLIKDQQ